MTSGIITVADVASGLGWSQQRTLRWLRRADAARKHGGRWVTSASVLLAKFPEAFEALAPDLARDDEEHDCDLCDQLRAVLLERDRQIDELARRLGTRAR